MDTALPEQMLDRALTFLSAGEARAGDGTTAEPLYAALDALPVPIYVTDPDGLVVYFNPACIDFAGRTPVVGHDRWCVTWKLFTDQGEFLPHDQCPMARAILERRKVRGMTAYAERPDGTRVKFMPYPTPLFDKDGGFKGAINMLIDVTDSRQAMLLRAQATRSHRLAKLAKDIGDTATQTALDRLALDYQRKADALDAD